MTKNTTTIDENSDENYAGQPREVSISALTVCINKYFDFSGRGSRSEYWWFYLYAGLAKFMVVLTAENLWGKSVANYVSLAIIFYLLSPVLAAGARRLHDINRSGWWQAFIVIPMSPYIFFTQDYWGYLGSVGFKELNAINVYFLPLWVLYSAAAVLLWFYWFTKKGKMQKNRFNLN